MRVLVLDDDPLTAFTLAKLFAIRGIQVVSVSTADAAERSIQRERFDAVLVDAQADGANGLRVLARARQLHADISLFLLSDQVAEDRREDADIYYIEKPWDGFFVVDIVRARAGGEPVTAGASGRLRVQDERPTVDIRPMRKERRPVRDSAAP